MKPDTFLKSLIWLYAVLLIFEGALRKWVLPGYSDALLVVRDPVVILIYLVAMARGRFPLNGWVITTAGLAVASVVAALLAGQDNLLITAYGLRSNFLHLPLIWVMAATFDRRDTERLGQALLLLAIPMTLLMVLQFKAPIDSPLNRGVGLDDTGGQLYGALGHIRPPGFFSFITGPNLFYPLVTAVLFHQFKAERRLRWWLLVACGLAVLLALPVSISRTAMVAALVVASAYGLSLFFTGLFNAALLRLLAVGALVVIAIGFLPVFDDAREAFLSRWDTATQADEVGVDAVTGRVFGGGDYLADVLNRATLFGKGVGMGSNVAARLTTGRMGFLLAENEWAKCLLELGLPLGLAFLGLRFSLALGLLRRAFSRLRTQRDPLPWLLWSASTLPLISGQWAQPTSLGFATLGAGLCLAACQDEPDEEEEEETEEEDTEEGAVEPPREGGAPAADTAP